MDQPPAYNPSRTAVHDAMDYAAARNNMVDGQIRPNRVNDPRVLAALRSLPREQFVPPSLASVAYVDEDLPLGNGRVLMEPLIIARLVQIARVREGEKVLVVASGSGYGAALMAACGARVTALEEDDALMAIALRILPRVAPSVRLVDGRISAGLPAGGPWDVVMIEGAVTAIPHALAAQVAASGRLVTVVAAAGAPGGQAVLAEPAGPGGALRSRGMFDCATAQLPGLRQAPAFVF